MTMPDVDWTALSNIELAGCQEQIHSEQERRRILDQVPAQIDALNRQYLDAEGTVPGNQWRRPDGPENAYPNDWTVTHQDKTWHSLANMNATEPGVSPWWAEEPPEEEWPDWVQPYGGHDAYPLGAQVSHVSKHWISTIAANVWEPGSVGAESLWDEQE